MKKSISIVSLFVIFTLSGLNPQEVASLKHATDGGLSNSIVQVDADTYVLAYTGYNSDGYITTFTIPTDGSSITEVASLEHDTDRGVNNSIVQVDADTYALAYAGTDYDGYITTFTIPTDGSSITEVASLEHDTNKGLCNSFIQVDSDTYALAYSGANEGQITTFTIPTDGSSITEVASLNHDTEYGCHNSFVQVDSDTYVLAYTGADFDAYIKTFTIPTDGSSITEVASLEHVDTGTIRYMSIVQVDADTYALAYAGFSDDGYIKTFTIPADGSTITEVALLEHDTGHATDNSFVQVDSDTYVLAYTGPGVDGHIATFTISADGSSIIEVDELEHDDEYGQDNAIVQVDADTYALAFLKYDYPGGFAGWIKTFSVASDGSLPVELTSFHVLSTRSDAITLQWITESEINNLGFILDRRKADADWTEIASYITHPGLQGQGSVTHQTIYTYKDNTVISEDSYDYRLADVDYDGNKEYHGMQVLGVSPSGSIPETFMLHPAYPNPFNPITSLRYDLPEQAQITLTVYDMLGREVTQLINTTQEAGYKSVQWNATDMYGKPVSAGVYLYQIQAGEFVQTRKMVLLK